MGLKYQEDFELKIGGQKVLDDDMIIDDSRMREPYDCHIYSYLNDDRRAYYYIPIAKTNEERLKNIYTWQWIF